MTLRPATPEELANSLRAAAGSNSRIPAVDLAELDQVIEYTPEDLTVTVQAGLTLAALQNTLASSRQWLPIDPPHPESLTVAALLDSNASGPRRYGCGTIRDHLIGLRVALADGRLIRSGGRVVKNVAGYDLMKLFVGARGTLGAIVEATFKLLPLPETEIFVGARRDSPSAIEPLLDSILESELTPAVFDLHNLDPQGERDSAFHMVLGFAGARRAVEYQIETARRLGIEEAASLDFNARFHSPKLPEPRRLSVLPSRLIETVRGMPDTPFVARAGNGIILHRTATVLPGGDLPRGLMERVKLAFDPGRILPEIEC